MYSLEAVKKVSTPKLIRQVFYKTSSAENMLEENNSEITELRYNEITALKDQVNSLQQSIFNMQEILEMKEKALKNVYKEKEKILADLKRHKRSNMNLRQQLEDEREHHMKEKEYYCKEMAENYKLRQNLKKEKTDVCRNDEYQQIRNDENKNDLKNARAELARLKMIVNETLEANYNLSIKYLRMKNTKFSLKSRYKRIETEQNKVIYELKQKLDDSREELSFIVSEKFRTNLSTNNKKYLQIVKGNNQLIQDNVGLQIEISKLANDIEKLKADRVRLDTNSKLRYIKKTPAQKTVKFTCDKISQTDFEEKQDTSKDCRSNLIFRENNIELSDKDYDYSDENIVNEDNFNAIRTQSAPEIVREEIFVESNLSLPEM